MDKNYLNRAVKCAEMGWKLFPSFYENGHRPLIKWGKNSSSDPESIRLWATKWKNCYFCINLKASDLSVIDVDNKKGKKGSTNLFKLTLDNEPLTKTLKIKTPTGGFHYVFEGSLPFSTGKLAEGIDTPVMIPMPGTSIPKKGGDYQILDNIKPLPRPTWVLDKLIAGRKPRKEFKEIEGLELDTPVDVKAAINYLLHKAPIAEEGKGGDNTTFSVACMLRDFAISDGMTYDIMAEHWNDRCEPPWNQTDLYGKVQNAYEFAQNPPGTESLAAKFDIVPEPQEPHKEVEEVPVYEKPRDAYPCFEAAILPREWVVDNVIPKQEITLLYGPGGTGKSRLALQLGVDVARGADSFLDMDITESMPVLYISFEDKWPELERRMNEIGKAPGYKFIKPGLPLKLWPRVGKSTYLGIQNKTLMEPGKFYAPLKHYVTTQYNGKEFLVIFDTLSDLFAVNENDRQLASYCVKNILAGLIAHTNCTVVVVGHPSKTGMKEGAYDSGSTAWVNSARSMLVMLPHPNSNLKYYRKIKHIKSNYSERIEDVLLRYKQGVFVREDEDNIVDEVREKNEDILLKLFADQCIKKQPVGLHHAKVPCLYTLKVTGADGVMMSKELKKEMVDQMVADGIVVEVTKNAKRERNGLWPSHLLKR